MNRFKHCFLIIFLLSMLKYNKKMPQAIGHVIYKIERIGLMHLLLHHPV